MKISESIRWVSTDDHPLLRHLLSSEYPQAGKPEWERLEGNMRQYGFLESKAITIYQGKVLDGWHRYNVARKIGLRIPTRQFIGTDSEAEEYVYRENAIKRTIPKATQAAILITRARRNSLPIPDFKTVRRLTGISDRDWKRLNDLSEDSQEAVSKKESNLRKEWRGVKRDRLITLSLQPIRGSQNQILIDRVETIRAARRETEIQLSVEMARCYLSVHDKQSDS